MNNLKFIFISLEMSNLGTVPDLSIVDAIAVGLAGKLLILSFFWHEECQILSIFSIISVAKNFCSKKSLYQETTVEKSQRFKQKSWISHSFLIIQCLSGFICESDIRNYVYSPFKLLSTSSKSSA